MSYGYSHAGGASRPRIIGRGWLKYYTMGGCQISWARECPFPRKNCMGVPDFLGCKISWCRGVLAAVAGVCFCFVEEGTHLYSTIILFWEICNRLPWHIKADKMYLHHTPKKASFGSPEGKNVSGFWISQNKICQMISTVHAKHLCKVSCSQVFCNISFAD